MGKIIPTANANGVSLEQLGAGYAIMTSKGIAAAETTTYMNSMLNELGKSGTSADKLLRSTTGSSFKELMASGKSLGDVLGILQQAAEESGKSLSDVFGSAEAGKAAVSLLSNGVDGFNESVQGMIDSAGATDAAFAQMENTTEAKMANVIIKSDERRQQTNEVLRSYHVEADRATPAQREAAEIIAARSNEVVRNGGK